MTTILRVLGGRRRDLGGFSVRRLLPGEALPSVGPFIFFDHMGPAQFAAGAGLDVRPHPHIGLATVTYLFEGEIFHRDSLGNALAIRPGDVNWMVAGRGIVHSERTAPERRSQPSRLHGIQSWLALPREHEETDPAFAHHPASSLPQWRDEGAVRRLMVGTAYGASSPVATLSPTFYVDVSAAPASRVELPREHEQRALYVADGRIDLDGTTLSEGQLAQLGPGDVAAFVALTPARVLLLGGAPLDGPRHLWWNFVSSSKDRIELARRDWRTGAFAEVPGETERTPLPGA